MAEATLPEEIIVLILSWLPVKSLLRFTCVSKRFHFIILSDPKFAKSQFQAARERKTLTSRLLCSTTAPQLLESLDLETPSFGDRSSVRKLKLPLRPPANDVMPLGSCNGVVFLAIYEEIYYMWNPSTGFFKKLPDPGFYPNENEIVVNQKNNKKQIVVNGVGYLQATDDYKVFVVSADFTGVTGVKVEAAIFSSRAHAWKTIEVDASQIVSCDGILLKEALHWLNNRDEIVAFDLAQEDEHKFREMLLPNFHDEGGGKHDSHLGVSAGGCLSLASYLQFADCIDVWVMREYDVRDSWTKLFNLKLSDPPKKRWSYNRIFVTETSMVAEIYVRDVGKGLVKILQKKEDKCSIYMIGDDGDWIDIIEYQESLLRIDD